VSCDVSVVLPAYNSSATLQRALDSVYGQSLLPRDIIVVDDGSNDWEQSRRIAASCPSNVPIRFIHEAKNRGPSTARNIGVAAARGHYLAFLDSDDVWCPHKLAIQYGVMARSQLDFSVHDYAQDLKSRRCDGDESPGGGPRRPSSKVASLVSSRISSSISCWSLLVRNFATPTVMVVRPKMVLFDTSLQRCEDWKCWMELLSQRDCRGAHIGCVLAGGFKRSLGVSGLSQDVKAMHASKMRALTRLLKENTISPVQYLVGVGLETVKYPVRVLRVRMSLPQCTAAPR